MKLFIKHLFVNSCSLLILSYFYPGLKIVGGLETIILAGLVITLINLIIKPFLKLLFLPINLLTLGLFRWVVNVICLFLLSVFVSAVNFSSFKFAGFSHWGVIISPVEISFFVSLVICSFLLSLIVGVFYWLFEEN